MGRVYPPYGASSCNGIQENLKKAESSQRWFVEHPKNPSLLAYSTPEPTGFLLVIFEAEFSVIAIFFSTEKKLTGKIKDVKIH